MDAEFHFKAQDEESMNRTSPGTSRIRNIVGFEGGAEAYVQRCALCLGQLKTLFGEPLYVSDDMECQYEYCILARDGAGGEVYLQVYSGSSGPAIGGKHDRNSKKAADALAEAILNSRAADYSYEGFYGDGCSRVKMGVRNGEPYWEETPISDEASACGHKDSRTGEEEND